VGSRSEYEESAHRQIHEWKSPGQSWFDKVMAIVSWPIDKAARALLDTPGLGPAIQRAFSGFVGVINDIAQWSVRPEAILEEYRRLGHTDISALAHVYGLDLSAVDHAIGWLDTKYEGMALLQGSVAGGTSVLTPLAALAVIPTDVTALLVLNLRAVGEYATYCGFDVSLPQERLFALNVLALASSPSDGAKQIALAQLVRIARDVALRRSWQTLEEHVAVQAAQKIAQALSIRLTKAKLAQVIPVAGAAIGGGFNAYYTDKVCKAAFYLYRERFLAEKYGPDEIEVPVEPAPTLLPGYETEP
jgi:EcsC protein family